MTVEAILGILVVALAAHRAARALSTDTISDRLRAWIYDRAFIPPAALPEVDDWKPWNEDDVAAGIVEPPEERIAPPIQTRSKGWAYLFGGLSCPHCCGFWISIALYGLWINVDDLRVWIAAGAAAGLQSVISARGMVADA
jgi:hypothetical protein